MNTITPNTETRVGRMLDGGRVTVTFTSPKTGEHITVTAKSRAPQENGKWGHATLAEAKVIFFEVPNSDGFNDKIGKYTDGKGFTADPSADKARVFCAEMLLRLAQGLDLPAGLEAREESRCGCCGRPLTDPVSIDRGIGPECFGASTGSLHQTKDKPESKPAPAPAPEPTPIERDAQTEMEWEGEMVAREEREYMTRTRPAVDKNNVPYGYGDWRKRKAQVEAQQGDSWKNRPLDPNAQSDFGGKPGDDGSLMFFMTGTPEVAAA